MSLLLKRFKFYLVIILGVIFLSLGGYTYYLGWRVKQLKNTNVQLSADLNASTNQIKILTEREVNNKLMEAEYEKLRTELSNKENGPVADVLRFAVDADVMH